MRRFGYWRVLPIVLTLGLLALSRAETQADDIRTAVVNSPKNNELVTLYALPTIASDSLGMYYNNVEVEVIDDSDPSGDWVKVHIGAIEGYMWRDSLIMDARENIINCAMPMVKIDAAGGIGLTRLPDEYSAYDVSYAAFFPQKFPGIFQVEVMGISGDWYHVRENGDHIRLSGSTGYVPIGSVIGMGADEAVESATHKHPFYGDVSQASIEIGESAIYSREDIQEAMAIALGRFTEWFKDSTMVRLYYDESISLNALETRLVYEKRRLPDKELIVLHMDFKTGSSFNGLSCWGSYTDYEWILARDKDGCGWTLVNNGYQ